MWDVGGRFPLQNSAQGHSQRRVNTVIPQRSFHHPEVKRTVGTRKLNIKGKITFQGGYLPQQKSFPSGNGGKGKKTGGGGE